MDFKKTKPIYQQIAEMLSDRILEEQYAADERLPSVRDVAADLGVNPNTVARAFEALAQEEVIVNRRGVGYFVATDGCSRVLTVQRRQFLEEELPQIRKRMQSLGLDASMLCQANQ